MLEPTCKASQLIAALHAMIEQRGDLPVYARDPDTDLRLPLGLVFAQADNAEGWPERLELTTDYNRPPPGALAKGTPFTPGVKTDI
jgi:hypothetical protein